MPLGEKILLIKLGALGDVVRTTAILNVLEGDVTWVTDQNAIPLLAPNCCREIISFEEAGRLKRAKFDRVICLDDEPAAARLAVSFGSPRVDGSFWNPKGYVDYSQNAAEWFDMSLISRYGLLRANRLKMDNRKSYQEMIFRMLGKKFAGQEYRLPIPVIPEGNRSRCRIGVESRSGGRWPGKRWNQYERLMDQLADLNLDVFVLGSRPSLAEYIKDIGSCDIVITGDTLALHLALGLRKRVVGVFTCTSPYEIYDYGRLHKVISPRLNDFFYSRDQNPEIAGAVTYEAVWQAVESVLTHENVVTSLT